MEPLNNQLKAISRTDNELVVENYIVLFGGRDLEYIKNEQGFIDGDIHPNPDGSLGEYFDRATKFDSTYTNTGTLYVDWEHGTQPVESDRHNVLGIVDWKTATIDENGIKVRRILDRQNQFIKIIEPLIDVRRIGNSSEPIQEGIKKADNGYISQWPLRRDTLTVTPTEPRMLSDNPMALKALQTLAAQYPHLKALIPEKAGTALTDGATASGEAKPPIERTRGISGEELDMTEINEEMVAKIAADAAAAAVKAEREAREAEEKARAELEAHDKEVAEKAIVDFKKELPATDKFGVAPAVAKHGDVWKYDNYPASDLAAVSEIVKAANTGRPRADLVGKALALRLESEEANDESKQTMAGGRKVVMPGPLKMAARAMKVAGVKADEYDSSTNDLYGDQWIGVAYGGQLWESVREAAPIVDKVPQFEFPAGAESMVIPVESTDPIWYLVAQADPDPGATTRVTLTVPAKALGTLNQSMTLGKIGSATGYTGEMVEDAMLPFVAQLRTQIGLSGGEYLAHCLIDGDVDTGSTTNINKIEGSPAGNEAYLVFDGFRNLALVGNTANSRDGGVISTSDFLETVKLMGAAGKDGFDRRRVSFIIDPPTHWKCLELADVKTKDVFSGATLEGGQLIRVYGYAVIPSYQMHFASVANTGYEYKTEATGKIDLTTASDNTKGAILAVRWDHWRLGFRRRVTTEVERIPRADSWEITSILRAGFQYRDTEAAAISYNLTV